MLHEIESAIEQHLLALPGEPIIAYWGRLYEPVKGVPYILAQITAQNVRAMGYGASAPELWEGFLQITVAHPRVEGPTVARQRADAVRNHFPRGLNLSSGPANVIIMERSIQPMITTVDWINYPVIINWICEEVHV
jgi:hypothetical protein